MTEESLFLAALEKPPAEREAFLEQACGPDAVLRARVQLLLEADARARGILERGAVAPPHAPGVTMDSAPPLSETEDYGDPTARVGAVLAGKYKLVEAIGEGGMGSVFLAQQTEPVKRAVAIKVIKAGMDSRAVLARFEAERQALALMDHPNIAKVLDAGTTEIGRPFFVMELVKGTPITRYCDEHKLTPRQRLELFVPVCQAIQHAHQKGIIHRDIKPSNVLVALYDDRPVPKVIDFGVAKAAAQALTDKTLMTGFGALVGTPEYMSPEQASLNNLDIDTRSDVYSLGVLLYELLTGTTPLDRKSLGKAALLEILRIVREVEAPRPSAKLSTIDTLPSVAANRGTEPAKLSRLMKGELDWLVMKALEKDRTRRYETANGLARDIQRYLVDEVVEARPPSASYRLRKFAQRNKGVLTAAALVSLALILALVVLAISHIRINDALAQAKTNEDAASANAATANERAMDLARRIYIYRVNLAQREAMANNVAQADTLLEDCEPSRRSWEWVYTKRLCHLEAMTLGGFRDHASAVAGARRASSSALAMIALPDQGTIPALGAGRGWVRSVAYSPDGCRIATAHDDGTIGIWDARTGREIRSLTGHVGCVSCVTFDDDGSRLISGGFDKSVRVWDTGTGEEKLVLRGHSRPVTSVAFRPGANQVASSVHGALETFLTSGFEIKQWDLRRGREIRTLHHRVGWNVSSVAFSPDGRRLLSTSVWGGQLRIWDPESGEEVEAPRSAERSLGLSVSPTDGRIAFGRGDGNVVGLTDPGLGKGLRALRGHSGTVMDVTFSRDGAWLASASEDGTIKIWAVANGREVKHLRGHTGSVTAVAFSPDGTSLVSSSTDGTVKVWDVRPARDPYPLNFLVWVRKVRFTPDGRRMAIGRFDIATVLDVASNRQVFQIPSGAIQGPPLGQRGYSDDLAYSRDGRLLATAIFDRINLWDAQTGRPVANCQGQNGHVESLAFGAGNLLASAWDDGTVRFWDAATGRAGAVIPAHEGGALSVAFNPAGTMLASVGGDGKVRLWDGLTGRTIRDLARTVQRATDHWGDLLGFSPDGRHLAVACADGTVHIYEVASGNDIFTLRGHATAVDQVVYSPDGSRIATGGSDHTIKLWDAVTGDEVFTLRGHTGAILGLAFSPDGCRILSTGADGMVWAWDGTPLFWSAASMIWNDPDRAAEQLRLLLQSNADFQSRIRMLSEPTRLYEALEKLDKLVPNDERVQIALAVARARRLAVQGNEALAEAARTKARVLLEQKLAQEPENSTWGVELADLLLFDNRARWTILKPVRANSELGATLSLLPDHSILASGANPLNDRYRVVLTIGTEIDLTAVRLEALTHPALPRNGPGRNAVGSFAQASWNVTALSRDLKDPIRLQFDNACADHEIPGYPMTSGGHWNIAQGGEGKNCTAVWSMSKPVSFAAGTTFTFEMQFLQWNGVGENLGRFRLSVSGDSAAFARFAARQLTDPWAKLAAVYLVIGDQQAVERLVKHHPQAAVGLGDVYAAAKNWERAIAEYRKAVTDHPADSLLTKLAMAYESAGRTRESVPFLVKASAANPKDTLLSLKVAALQAWFGEEKQLAATRQRMLAFARGTNDLGPADNAARACSILPSTDKAELEAALALGRTAAKVGKGEQWWEWNLLALGMAEYRSGNHAAALEALLAAEKAGANNPLAKGIAAFYRAMSLFRQGKPDEAHKVANAAVAQMRPLPKDEQNPFADGAYYDDLILWLAYKEAKAMIQFDAALPAKLEKDKK